MVAPAAKAQAVGWPPIRSDGHGDDDDDDEPGKKHGPSSGSCLWVEVSMDGAPYLRKVDLKSYHNYKDLSSALEKMFCFTIACLVKPVRG